ncbi:MFS transporter [Pueribacillus theae]|uniref:MFS transporter n=1 Tax=Pueribacillus theae TaxID=2171751 RepID=A0A2U1JYH3_9BACI|nr:MFS transporter [Pueribacillus theae]PWA10035.1 MFS transporter [Pueribacillus theae]
MPDAAEKMPGFNEKIIIPFWSIMVWLVLMNTSMFNVVMPSIISDLQISPAAGSWIVTGYSLFLALSTFTFSRLSDFIPIRKLLMIGMMTFGLASLAAFFSNTFLALLAARIVQASGAGASQALGMVLAARYIPLVRRGRAMASISLAASLAFGLGPVVGGLLAQKLGWNFLFLVTCLVLFLLPVFFKHLPHEQLNKGTFDFWGCLFVAASTANFMLFLTTLHFIYLAISLAAFGILWWHIGRAKAPFIQSDLLKNRSYLMIVFIGLTAFSAHFATLFCMPLYLSEFYGKQSMEIGFAIFPGAMLSAVSAIFVGRLIDRFGTNLTMILGNVLLLCSTTLFFLLSAYHSSLTVLAYLLMSLGFFSLTASISNELTRILPAKQIGAGLGLQQLINFIGVGIGVSIAGVFVTKQKHLAAMIKYQNTFLFFAFLSFISCCVLLIYVFKKNKRNSFTNSPLSAKTKTPD